MTKKELIEYLTNEIIRNNEIRKSNRENYSNYENENLYLEGYIDGLQKALGKLKRLSFKNKDKSHD
ncbi:MAG: hypothetical protein Unbinned6284contig1004_40 [Prokaryotic dsDNA virus sp.]|nr:MAG: hypothetical protein Unbinned6284contig1004_40 [Prokaryotic dsDNA virus sp.]|tara:strand:- start:5226 stop:5423 length:198 start_codon:yes stop_codon:yes gene_type:complete